MVNQNDTKLLYDWPYAEQLIFKTLSSELIESHGKAHLWRALNSGRAIAVVGSGATMAYGRPAWSGILENMRAWIINQHPEVFEGVSDYTSHYEFLAARMAFRSYGLEDPVKPGGRDYTTMFQIMENLYVVMETITAEAEAFRNGRTPGPGIRADAKQRFRTHFRHHFRGHVKRCHGMNERLARVMYPDQKTPEKAVRSFRNDVLAIYRSRMMQIERDNYGSDIRKTQEKNERSIRNLLAPRWMFDDTLDKDAIDDEAPETSIKHEEGFLFGVELATNIKDEITERLLRMRDSGVDKYEKRYLKILVKLLENSDLKFYFPPNSTAIPQEGLWFLSEVLVSLVGATSPKTDSLPPGLHAQSTERWADPTCIYKEERSPAKDDDANPLFHILQKCAYEFAEQDGNSSMPTAQRTILARDPLTVLFRELDITRFMTTNYDLEIESMFEHHGFQLQTLDRGEGNDVDDISRQVYTNVTGERATSLDFRSENAASMIDFSLDERADISHVVHLHGSARPGVELAVTEDDYKSFHVTEHSRRDAGRSAMDLAFTSNPLVFVGLGMDEPDILRPLRAFSTETGDLSERPAIAILARTGGMAGSLFDRPTRELKKSVENATAKRSAELLAKWGVMPVFFGTAKRKAAKVRDDEMALARMLFHFSRVSRDKALTSFARAASEASDSQILMLFKNKETLKFAKDIDKQLKTHGPITPLRNAFKRFNTDYVSEIERQPFNKVKFDFECLVARWPEAQFFRYLVEKIDGATTDPEAVRNVCYFVRAYRDLCLGIEQNIQTMFLTAFLNRCALERAEWLSRWTKVPRARRTIVNVPKTWTRSKA